MGPRLESPNGGSKMSTTLCNFGVHVMADRVRYLRKKSNTPDWAYDIKTYQHYGTAVHPIGCKCTVCDDTWIEDIRNDSAKRQYMAHHDEFMSAYKEINNE